MSIKLSNTTKAIIGLIAFVIIGIQFTVSAYAQTNCDEFIFNWFQLNDCLGNLIGGSRTVNIFNMQDGDMTANNSTNIVNMQNGDLISTNDTVITYNVINGSSLSLDDLDDVTVISPSTGEIIRYNGSQWVNVAETTFNDTTSCTNLGTGTIICIPASNVELKSLVAGIGITLSNSSSEITITNSAPESTSCANLGTSGQGIYESGNCNFKKLLAGSSVSLSSNSTHITITNTAPESTSCANVNPTGEGIYVSGNCNFKKLLSGTGITLASNSTRITITNSLPEIGCSSAGGTTLLKTGSTCDFKGLTSGAGITITSNTNDNQIKTNFVNGTGISITGSSAQTITNTGVTSLSSDDTSSLSYSGSTGAITASPKFKKLCEVVATGSETTLTCTLSSSSFKAFRIVASHATNQADTIAIRFNGDSGSNYATRSSTNGAADSTAASQGFLASVTETANQWYHYNYQCNEPLSTQEKHCYGSRTTSPTGAASADSRVELASKWANTASLVTDVELVRTAGTGTFTSGAFLQVWAIT